ncbi:hypothetical protein LUZ60_007786 [Juncus effusus]|nr:hypothetical protein LUZ60_007786 [Juncus effusus]
MLRVRAALPLILHQIPHKSPQISRIPLLLPSLNSRPQTVRRNASSTEQNPSSQTLTQLPFAPPKSAYIHLPFCRKRCHYCDFTILALGSAQSEQNHDNDPRISNYINLLLREIESTNKLESEIHLPLETIFFGGGTPSLVPPNLISSILSALNSKFGISKNAEISIEMDPGTFDAKRLKEILNLGVNRVSLGVQAFQEELLQVCGRAHGLKEVYEAIEMVNQCEGLNNWSLDLISSLPNQTEEMWKESLTRCIDAGPTHVSVYDLQIEQGTKFGNLYKPGVSPLPSDTQSAEFYKIASETLTKNGYNHYEISSYSKDSFFCKHNSTYWKNKPFYGFGLGSTSFTNGIRFSRPKKLKEYSNWVETLEKGEMNCENGEVELKEMAMDVIMLSLRTSRGLDLREFGENFGLRVMRDLCRGFEPFRDRELVLFLDREREVLSREGFEGVEFVRLSDPDGFLLSNEIISVAFGVISS